MLEELSKKDKQWRQIAFNICKDKSLADDLVQEMYLKLYNYEKQINDFFVIIVIRNLFLDYCRKKKYFISIEDINITNGTSFEIDDYHYEILKATEKLKFYEIELLDMSGEHSLRDLANRYNINYQKVNRIVTKAKKKIWQEVENQKNNPKD
jgi:RNA polymerase sigma factor (sigma-70 family)